MEGEWTIVMQPIAVKIGGGDVSLDTLPNSRNLDEGRGPHRCSRSRMRQCAARSRSCGAVLHPRRAAQRHPSAPVIHSVPLLGPASPPYPQ
eukprot:685368-Prymnesium_polylepis.1